MRYGATFKVEIYDYEEGKSEEVITRASDYLQMQLWGDKATKDLPKAASDLYGNYALAWFALKREGRLSDYGLDDAPLTVGALDAFAARASLYVSFVEEGELPLAGARKK